jgi:hypothetical protein
MAKAKSSSTGNKVRAIEPFDKRKVDFKKFKRDVAIKELNRLLGFSVGNLFPPIFGSTIDTLSPVRTVGRGLTNLTLAAVSTFQTDAIVPRAFFDRAVTPTRAPVVQIHFEPKAYGITFTSNYVVEFTIEVFTQGTFDLNASGGILLNPGSRTVTGKTIVTAVLRNVPPAVSNFIALTQTAGPRWEWFSTRIAFPPIVATQ